MTDETDEMASKNQNITNQSNKDHAILENDGCDNNGNKKQENTHGNIATTNFKVGNQQNNNIKQTQNQFNTVITNKTPPIINSNIIENITETENTYSTQQSSINLTNFENSDSIHLPNFTQNIGNNHSHNHDTMFDETFDNMSHRSESHSPHLHNMPLTFNHGLYETHNDNDNETVPDSPNFTPSFEPQLPKFQEFNSNAITNIHTNNSLHLDAYSNDMNDHSNECENYDNDSNNNNNNNMTLLSHEHTTIVIDSDSHSKDDEITQNRNLDGNITDASNHGNIDKNDGFITDTRLTLGNKANDNNHSNNDKNENPQKNEKNENNADMSQNNIESNEKNDNAINNNEAQINETTSKNNNCNENKNDLNLMNGLNIMSNDRTQQILENALAQEILKTSATVKRRVARRRTLVLKLPANYQSKIKNNEINNVLLQDNNNNVSNNEKNAKNDIQINIANSDNNNNENNDNNNNLCHDSNNQQKFTIDDIVAEINKENSNETLDMPMLLKGSIKNKFFVGCCVAFWGT